MGHGREAVPYLHGPQCLSFGPILTRLRCVWFDTKISLRLAFLPSPLPSYHSAFYKLLDELQTECEGLISRGISGTGAGFDGPSAGRLGSHAWIPVHNPEPGGLRDAALKVVGGREEHAHQAV